MGLPVKESSQITLPPPPPPLLHLGYMATESQEAAPRAGKPRVEESESEHLVWLQSASLQAADGVTLASGRLMWQTKKAPPLRTTR